MKDKIQANTNTNELNFRIRAIRQALGLTQDEVGGLVGISGVIISLYERGLIDSKYGPSIESKLNDVWTMYTKKYGAWYNSYLSLQAATNEIQIWMEINGYVPENIVKKAKACALAFTNM